MACIYTKQFASSGNIIKDLNLVPLSEIDKDIPKNQDYEFIGYIKDDEGEVLCIERIDVMRKQFNPQNIYVLPFCWSKNRDSLYDIYNNIIKKYPQYDIDAYYAKTRGAKQFAKITVDLSDSDRYRLYDAFACYLHQPFIDNVDRKDILAVAEKLIPNLVNQMKK